MERIIRRGREAADKDFPVITPGKSDWKIREALAGANETSVCREAAAAGFAGEFDVLLCFPRPSPSSPQKNQALGLLYVGEAARQFYGFRVAYWDARHDKEEDFLALAAKANTIGFSAITGFQLGEFVRLASQVKKRWPDKPIILGGAHATLTDPETNLADPLVDYLVMGEGELRLPALLRAIYRPEYLPLVDGIGYRGPARQVAVQKRVHVPDLERDMPDVVNEWTIDYFLAAARRNEMILPASRGCPWSTDSCDFCSVGPQYMDSYRKVPFRLWQRAIDEVLKHVRFQHIELEDENSATVIKPTEPYLAYLKSENITSHLHLRSDQLLDSERVRWMAEMGVVRVHIGVESGSERVLNQVMHKHEPVEAHYVAARTMAAAGIEEVATAIVANPTETWPEMRQTLQMMEKLRRTFPHKMFRATVYVLAALPGTPVYADIRKMHAFCDLLKQVEAAGGSLPEELRAKLASWRKAEGRDSCGTATPKAADSVQPYLAAFLDGTGSLQTLREEARKWLWPMPETLRDWTRTSAAFNPKLKPHINAIYPVAGIHFNKAHKGKQNFPGWKQILIKPFDILCDVRFWLAADCGFEWALKGTGFELWLIARLLSWASKRSVGVHVDRNAARARAIEGYSKTLAGH
jgi:anaerobic magnesium-protoporphyrin IX monomethyl ester cyclase